jgi:hypothetical protein
MKTSFGYLDAKSKSIIWDAYAKHFGGEEIMEEGFNLNSGYVYLALENGVTIASNFGQEVNFIVWDEETEDEIIFDSYEELEIYLIKQNDKN